MQPSGDGKEHRSGKLQTGAALSGAFVGNRCIDDNLAECVKLAIWKAVGTAGRGIKVEVTDGRAALSGEAMSVPARSGAVTATLGVPGIVSIEDRMTTSDSANSTPLEIEYQAACGPAIGVTRYCNLTEASVDSAVRQARAILEAFIDARGGSLPSSYTVVFRNLRESTVTVDVMYPVEANLATIAAGDVRRWEPPSGRYVSTTPAAGLRPTLAAYHATAARLALAGYTPGDLWWQVIPRDLDFGFDRGLSIRVPLASQLT